MIQSIRVVDHSDLLLTGDALQPFAWEELACRQVGQEGIPLLHLWRHAGAVILGLRDRKLPGAAEAMRWLESQGRRVCVRHSGGAIVPLDAGVLNVTLMLPKKPGQMEMKDDFRSMQHLIDRTLQAYGLVLQQGEIAGSFCPGEFDLSIRGRKFCGIAQRRQIQAIAVQAFVLVEGSGESRAALAQEFYGRAAGGSEDEYPSVRSDSMASLEELSAQAGCVRVGEVEAFRRRLLEALKLSDMSTAESLGLPALESREVQEMVQLIRSRYDR